MKISVITICFNSGKYLERAIKSVLDQDYSNWEHIVVDGGSTDETVEVLKKYGHLQWISESDKGQSDAMNKGFKLSSGDLIVYLNADDELLPGCFSYILRHFKNNPKTDLLVGNLLTDYLGEQKVNKPSISLSEILNYELCSFPLNPVSYSFKRSLQLKIGDFPVDNHYTMDYWFLLRAYLFGIVRKEEFVGGIFYFDGANKSSDGEKARKSLKKVRDSFLKQYCYRMKVFLFIVLHMKRKVQYILSR